MKEPYAYATIAITKQKLQQLLSQVCSMKDLEAKPTKANTESKLSLKLNPRKMPFFFYWSYDVEATILPEGIMLMIAARPHNHFICLPDERLRQSQHIMDLINSMLLLQEGQNTAGLHSTL